MDKPTMPVRFEYLGGATRASLDDSYLDELEIAYAVPHWAWRDNEWVDEETGLDVPPPCHQDVWMCSYSIRTDTSGNQYAVLMPYDMIDHGPPHYISPGQQVLIEQAYRRDYLYTAAGAL